MQILEFFKLLGKLNVLNHRYFLLDGQQILRKVFVLLEMLLLLLIRLVMHLHG